MTRSPLLLAALLAGPAFAAELPCTTAAQTWNSREVACRVPAAQRYVFTARFSGGHDDTMARLQPLLDGAPLACEAGSKTELVGEDGDVSLHCAFAVERAGDLRVTVRWSHAEYTAAALATR
jgi:hypothetical protein